MKTHIAQTGLQFFFHRYLIDSKKLNPDKRPKFQNDDQINLNSLQSSYTKTSLHKCKLVQVGQENLQLWPTYLLKRIAYISQKKEKKGKNYQVYDQNIKKVSQIRTQYLSYQIMNKSHRVVRMIELINQNSKKEEDQKFFYKFLARKKQPGIKNACFILQFCNDGTLEDRISSFKNPLNEDQIVMYSCQILQGLIQIKKKGILHRDLRPCNIFLHNDEVKFGDFDSAFIYKQSQCSDIKSGIDINTTPQQIVQLASLSDQQLQQIGNLKLFQLQAKCDIYFFGMIIFKMVFKRDYEKKFEGTDIQYLIRQKIKQGFGCPKLLQAMKKCLYTNVQKRIDLLTLFDSMKLIQKQRYFTSAGNQRAYLSEDPLNLFSFSSLDPIEPQLNSEIQNSISNTFTVSFESVQYDFEADFQKSTLNRSTKLYADQVQRVHSKFYKTQQNANLWHMDSSKRKQLDKFLNTMQDFVIQMSSRAYYYDYLYKVILKINTKSITKKQQKTIVSSNKTKMQRQLIIVLKFLFQMLARTPFKIDKNYSNKYLPYQTKKLFTDKIKINDKYNFFHGRAKTFNQTQFQTYQMMQKFFSIQYQDLQSDKFQVIYDNLLYMIDKVDKRLKKLLSQSIVDLFRPYDNSKKSRHSNLKQILFIMITLQKQKLQNAKKSNIILMKSLLEPLFMGEVTLDIDQAQLFFDNYKNTHKKEVEQSKQRQNKQISMNLLAVSKKHLDCLASFMAGPSIKKVSNNQDEEQFQNRQSQKKSSKTKSIKFTTQYEVFNDNKDEKQLEQSRPKEANQMTKEEQFKAQKQKIEVQVYEQNHLSQFDQNLQNSNFPIMA